MRRVLSLLCALVLVLGLSGLTAPTAAAADLTAPVGTGPQVAVRHPRPGVLTGVRVGRQATYDRIVFDVKGSLPGWDARYVSVVRADPSGRAVPVAGAADLRVVLTGISGYTGAGGATATVATGVRDLPAVRQIKPAGDVEAVMTFAVGVSDQLDFRVFGLSNPTRVVLDVAHPVSAPFTTGQTALWAPTGGGGDFTLARVRVAGHPTFDRVVLDLPGAVRRPNIGIFIAPAQTQDPTGAVVAVLWTYLGADGDQTPTATYTGPTTIRVGLANLDQVLIKGFNTPEMKVMLISHRQHGYRAFLLPGAGMQRLVVDVAH